MEYSEEIVKSVGGFLDRMTPEAREAILERMPEDERELLKAGTSEHKFATKEGKAAWEARVSALEHEERNAPPSMTQKFKAGDAVHHYPSLKPVGHFVKYEKKAEGLHVHVKSANGGKVTVHHVNDTTNFQPTSKKWRAELLDRPTRGASSDIAKMPTSGELGKTPHSGKARKPPELGKLFGL